VFTEPQFEPAIARTIVDGTGARLAELDPLGAELSPGAALYPELLEALAADLRDCLKGAD
jgi:zinc transport system substrate-binding protein